MKTILFFLAILPFFLVAQNCRYDKRIFAATNKTTDVVYSTAQGIPSVYVSESATTLQNLKTNIFMPVGDTAQQRACIIFAHSGGFLTGSKTNQDMQALCDSFAMRGYVTATIDYRMNFSLFNNASSERAVWRGTQDASAAVRFFKSNATTYKIDTSKIFFWGSSAGSFMALNLAYLDDAERPATTTTTPNLGCKDCSGTATINNSTVAGIISCWGAIKDTNWLSNNTVPTLLFHGTADNVVPFTEGPPFSLATLPIVRGSSQIHDYLLHHSKPHQFNYVTGVGHEYWGTNNGTFALTGVTQYWQDIIDKSRDFMLTTMGLPINCNNVLAQQNLQCQAIMQNNNTVKIEWQTNEIINTNNFVVEYSFDAINWNIAAEIIAKSNQNKYSFIHHLYSTNTNIFYRIKQNFTNKINTYSNIYSIKYVPKKISVTIYPNPANAYVNVLFNNKNNATITITNLYGKEMYHQKTTGSTAIKINTQTWCKGLYLLHIATNENTITQKLVVE